MNKKVGIVVVTYNRKQLLLKCLDSLINQKLKPDAIYIVDNNSTDNTYNEANKAGAIVRKSPNQGKGNVVKDMFNNIKADIYLMVDGDDTYPANRAKEMIRLIKKKNIDMVIGDRLSSNYHESNERQFHSFGNEFINLTFF